MSGTTAVSADRATASVDARNTRSLRIRVGLVLVAAGIVAIHLWRLGTPDDLITLDETYYVKDARTVVRYGTDQDGRAGAFLPPLVMHPPAGKWFIAAGIRIFGDSPFGWRFFGVAFGLAGSVLVALIARRLWPARPGLALAAAVLLGVEGLWFVLSRDAMLDIYLATFILAGIWLLIEDRARAGGGGIRWWRIGSGICFGLAGATKWSVAPYLLAAIALAVVWDLAAARGAPRPRIARRLAAIAATFVLLPAVVYVASYTPWFLDDQRSSSPGCYGDALEQWLCHQGWMMDLHGKLRKYGAREEVVGDRIVETSRAGHPYYGDAWSWPWIGRPATHFRRVESGHSSSVLGLPNPAIWWTGFAAFPLLGWWGWRRRDRTARVLFVLFAAGWVPYLVGDALGRPVYLYYAAPLIPFLVLAAVHVLSRAERRVAIASVLVAVLSFAFFYPVLAAVPVGADGPLGWRARLWLTADCEPLDEIRRTCWRWDPEHLVSLGTAAP